MPSIKYALSTLGFALLLISLLFLIDILQQANKVIPLLIIGVPVFIALLAIGESYLRAKTVSERIELGSDTMTFIASSKLPLPWFNSTRTILYRSISKILYYTPTNDPLKGLVQIIIFPFKYACWVSEEDAKNLRLELKDKVEIN